MNVELGLVAIDVQQDLRRLGDGGHRYGRMPVLEQGKVRQPLHLVHVGTGQPEEIAEHPVAAPIHGQVRKTVEQIDAIAAHVAEDLVNLPDKPLEARLRVELVDLDATVIRKQRVMAGEAEVDDRLAGLESRLATRFDKRPVVLRRVDLPDEVVPGQKALEDLVQARQPGGKWCGRHRQIRSSGKSSRQHGQGDGLLTCSVAPRSGGEQGNAGPTVPGDC
jgi:hypothetical protein